MPSLLRALAEAIAGKMLSIAGVYSDSLAAAEPMTGALSHVKVPMAKELIFESLSPRAVGTYHFHV